LSISASATARADTVTGGGATRGVFGAVREGVLFGTAGVAFGTDLVRAVFDGAGEAEAVFEGEADFEGEVDLEGEVEADGLGAAERCAPPPVAEPPFADPPFVGPPELGRSTVPEVPPCCVAELLGASAACVFTPLLVPPPSR
jgi:hypothetical protein